MMAAIRPVEPVSRVARVIPSKTLVREELFTLYYTSGGHVDFQAKSIPAAILIAKRKLDLVVTATPEKFRAAGGDYVLRNSTGNRIYPST